MLIKSTNINELDWILICLDWFLISGEYEWIEAPLILMQYTWLKDCNGTEIYEGDIVIGIKWDEPAPQYKVYFDKEILSYFVGNSKTNFHLCDLREMETIWNIYENQEILLNN